MNAHTSNTTSFYRQIYVILAIPPILLGVLYLLSVHLYLLTVLEDQLLEQLQISALIGAGILAYRQTRLVGPRQRFFLYFLTLATLILILEELSWGQRFLRFTSLPGEDGGEIEADFHNQMGERFDILTVTNWPLAFPPLIYGIVLPLLTRIRKMATRFEQVGLVLPQLVLAPGFVLGVIFIVADIGFYEEIGECVIYMSFMFALIDPWYGQNQNCVTTPRMHARLLPTQIFAGLITLSVLLWVGINAIWSPLTSTGLVYVHLDYADTFYDYALYDEAVAQYKIVIDIKPDLTYPRHKLIQSLLRSNNLTEAAQEAQKARTIAPLRSRLTNELKSHGIILETVAPSKMPPSLPSTNP